MSFETEPDLKIMEYKQDHRWWAQILQFAWVTFSVHYISWIFIPVGIYAYLYHIGYFWYAAPLIILYLPSFFDGSHLRRGRLWKGFRDYKVWHLAFGHNGVTTVRTTKLDPKKTYIFGFVPHGILALSRVTMYGGIWPSLFPGLEYRVLGATPMFWVPLCREMCLWLGGVDASRSTAENLLKSGCSLHIYPGGSKEIFETRPGSKETTLILKERLGFVKLAIRFGADLVPVVGFGEKEIYHKLHINEDVRKWFLRTLRIPLLVFWGIGPTWTPLRRPLATVFGAPIPVTKNPNPTDEEVAKLHQLFIDETEKLFNEYKNKFPQIPGAKDQTLIIK